MELNRRQSLIGVVGALGFVAALLLVGITQFGIWDPWELEAADLARRLAAGEAPAGQHAGTWLVSAGFRLFGVHEWAGRLPIALSGLVTVALAFLLARRFAGARAGLYAALITGTTPLFIFNARPMLGLAPLFAIQTAIAFYASVTVFGLEHDMRRGRSTLAWLFGTLVMVATGVAAGGALQCALPPLGAVALAAMLDGRLTQPRDNGWNAVAAYSIVGLALAMATAVALAIVADAAQYSPWLGGAPVSGLPPTFEAVVERVFHGFAPWSALLPLAFAHMLMPTAPEVDISARHSALDDSRLRLVVVLWAALGYVGHTLFLSRYGHEVAFLPVVALAISVALLLRDVERRGAGSWPAAMTALCLAGLLVRDFAIYPGGPVNGMPVSEFEVPEVFNPRGAWALTIGSFGVLAFFGLAFGQSAQAIAPLAPYRFLRQQWKTGLAAKFWLLGLAGLLFAVLAAGALMWFAPGSIHASTFTKRILARAGLGPLLLPVVVLAWQLLSFVYGKIARHRVLPMFAAAAGVALYASHGYLPALSAHFSPREVYESFNAVAEDGAVLGEFRVGGRAATYYAKGGVKEFSRIGGLVEYLAVDERRWAAFPADDLGRLNRMFRNKTRRHLFVVDARSARVILATNQPVEGRQDENPLSPYVLREAPKMRYPVNANLEDKIMFLGYDLKLPQGEHVGAGEEFDITWYFKSLKPVAGNYKMFIHIDSAGQRIHGDHVPVDGDYPVSMWDEGDIIVDHQTLEVQSNMRPGDYTIYVGFYSGEKRLKVVAGNADDANRINAGVLRVR